MDKTKRRYATEQIKELMKRAEKEMTGEMLEKALNSGALSDDMLAGNYLLAKAIIDIWCMQRPHKPLDKRTQKEFNDLVDKYKKTLKCKQDILTIEDLERDIMNKIDKLTRGV